MEAKPERKKVKQLEVMVAETSRETPDTTTILFFTGNDRLEYQPGHFLTIDPHQFGELERFTKYLEDQKGRPEPPRAYSLASAPHEKGLAITVKEERYVSGVTPYPPLLSPILARRLRTGRRLVVTGFTGPYTLREDLLAATDHLVHLCAGSGIVPNYSILKHALREHPALRHTLIYSNKTPEDIIYREPLRELARAHPDRLRVIHTLTRAEAPSGTGETFQRGRISEALLREAVPDIASAAFYVCGPAITPHDRKRAKEAGREPPPRFMETALAILAALGVDRNRIRRESYG